MKKAMGKIASITMLLCVESTLIASSGTRQAVNNFMLYCSSNHWDSALIVEMHAFSAKTYGDAPFANAVAAVSNNWESIINDWDYYGTNA